VATWTVGASVSAASSHAVGPQVALWPPTGPPLQPLPQSPTPVPGSSGKPLHSGVGFHEPSVLWHGVRSMPLSFSNHSIPVWIIEYMPPDPHAPPYEVMPKTRHEPSGICTNTGPP